jgi:hypothetical protein
VATGNGRTLGQALTALFSTAGRPGAPRSTYDRKGWRAQFAQLSATKSGYAAMQRAGLDATTRTQRGWLTGEVQASKANQGLIAQAYAAMSGGWNPTWQDRQYVVRGRLTQGRDSRERGYHGNSPLRLDGRLGQWGAIQRAWDDGADPETVETMFIEFVVIPNLGEGSYPWEFDGDRYEVSA